MKISEKIRLRALCEGALFIAAAQLLGYVKLFSLPNGGSITLNMLPIFIYCTRWGFGLGISAGFTLGLLQLFLDGAYAWGWQSIIGDYLLAYTVIGLAGLFPRREKGLFTGIILGSTARFLVSYVVGATVWSEYMPEHFFGMTMTSPWFYSALYNGSYIFSCMILDLAAAALLFRPLKGFLMGKDLFLKR